MFMLEQTSHGHIRQPTISGVDGHATHCRYLRWRPRVQRQRRSALRARLPAAVRRTEGRQLLQRWRQWLRVRRGPGLPARVDDDDDDGDWLWPTVVLVWTSKPPANCHNSRVGSRIPPRWDVARRRGFTNNAPYVVAVEHRAPVAVASRRTPTNDTVYQSISLYVVLLRVWVAEIWNRISMCCGRVQSMQYILQSYTDSDYKVWSVQRRSVHCTYDVVDLSLLSNHYTVSQKNWATIHSFITYIGNGDMFPIPVSAVEAVAMLWEFAGGFQRPLIEPLLRFAQNRWEISFSSTADTYTVSGKKVPLYFCL